MSDRGKNPIRKAFEWAISVDVDRAKTQVEQLRDKHPGSSKAELAQILVKRSRRWATGTGFVSGLPSNPWVAAPTGLADAATVLRIEIALAARVALIYDETFFDDESAAYELLVPIFGARVVNDVLKEMTLRGGMDLSRQLIKSYLQSKTLKQFKNLMFKVFGLRTARKAIATKTLPIVGGVLSSFWNFSELTRVGKRCIAYFEDEVLEPEPPESRED